MQHLADQAAHGQGEYAQPGGYKSNSEPPMLVTSMMQGALGEGVGGDERYPTVPHPSASMSPAPSDHSNGITSPAPSQSGPITSNSSFHPSSTTPSHLSSRQQSSSSATSNGSLGPGTGNGAYGGRPLGPDELDDGLSTPQRTSSASAITNGLVGQPVQSAPAEIVPVSFDEGVLRALCDLDVGGAGVIRWTS